MKRRILIVDDEEIFLRPLLRTVQAAGYLADGASSAEQAKELASSGEYDLVLSDVRMPGADGITFTKTLKEASPDLPVILMTAYGDVRTAVDALRAGAEDYLLKPFDPDEIVIAIRRVLEMQDLRTANRYRIDRDRESSDFRRLVVCESEAMKRFVAEVESILPLENTVLVTGETGVGKQLVARGIHYAGPRKNGPFIELNCAAIPETLFESELFGYVRGAFTGAVADRKGHFHLADGGTLFLDEIGEVPLALQSKLLFAIQEKKVMRLGGNRQTDVDARIIAATNKDLAVESDKGAFRKDLYYRLNVYPLRVPPLRERREDLPILADRFMADAAKRCHRGDVRFAHGSVDAMLSYDWPGNVREMMHVVERAVIRAKGEKVDVAAEIGPPVPADPGVPLYADLPFRDAKEKVVNAFEKGYVEELLRRNGGKMTHAARAAGMDNKNFHEKMKRHGL